MRNLITSTVFNSRKTNCIHQNEQNFVLHADWFIVKSRCVSQFHSQVLLIICLTTQLLFQSNLIGPYLMMQQKIVLLATLEIGFFSKDFVLSSSKAFWMGSCTQSKALVWSAKSDKVEGQGRLRFDRHTCRTFPLGYQHYLKQRDPNY